jgi:hypothetical protein
MTEQFINYLKYIGFLDDNSIGDFISLYNSNSDEKNKIKDKKRDKLINCMIQYIKSLVDNQLSEIMTRIYDRYNENKIKIESKKLLNLVKVYQNKEIKFYFIYWHKLSQYLKHIEIQRYQMQNLTIKYTDNKTINNSNTINGEYLDSITLNNNNNRSNFIPNNISMIKVRNSDMFNNNLNYGKKPSTKDFIERQEKYMQIKKRNLMKNIDDNEEEFQMLYTFKPCLEESTKSYYYGNNKGLTKKNRNFNLYTNKAHELKMKNLRKVVDNERGLTFKPRINSYKNCFNYKRNNYDL